MLRFATYEDRYSIYQMICQLEECQLPYSQFERVYEKQLSSDDYFCLVCQKEDRVVGVLNLRFEEPLHHAGKIAELTEFYIDPQYRGRGLGTEMFTTACQIARFHGCIQLELSCNHTRTAAHRFYQAVGMKGSHTKFVLHL